MCGIVGMVGSAPVNQDIYDALLLLQHRGQDATGIATGIAAGAGRRAPEALVVNPPRRGLGPELAAWIEESGIPTVIYSSCHAPSLVRDLSAMPSLSVRRARLFDMFPQTDHAETMVLLSRR